MEHHLTYQQPNLHCIPLYLPVPPPINARSSGHKTPPCAKHGHQFAAPINDVFYAVLDNPIKGLNGINLRTLVHHIATTYAQISQPDLDDNPEDFNMGIDPGLPLAVYTRKQESCQVFALNAAVPISKATMVTTGTKHALECSNMTMAWCK
jgi:hypothetical protein